MLAMLAGLGAGPAFIVGVIGTVVTLAALGAAAGRYFVRDQAGLEVRFPSAHSTARNERPPSPL